MVRACRSLVLAWLVLVLAVPGIVAAEDERPLFIEIEVGAGPVFVQSEVPIALRIFDSVGMRDGSLSDLTAEGAVVTREGTPKSYLRTRGKRQYRVIEQGYVMRPQRSGRIELQPVTLFANVPSNTGEALPLDRRFATPGFQSPLDRIIDPGKEITLDSSPVAVEVTARPADAQGWFLPARGVTLTATWSGPVSDVKVGDTLTRTIRLEARGASPNQLPPLPVPDVEGLRQYEDASRSDNAQVGGEAGAVAVKTVSVVPTRAGPVTLPPIEVAWWNIETDRQERAVVPAVTLTVGPDSAAAGAEPAPAGEAAAGGEASGPPGWFQSLAGRARELGARELSLLSQDVSPAGLAVAGALAALAALLCVAPWWFRRRRTVRFPSNGGARLREAGLPAEEALAAACRAGDAAAAHRAILAWMRDADEHPAERPRTARMAEALEDLRRHLYAAPGGAWNGRALLAAFRAEQRARRRPRRTAGGARLAPLYPEAG